MAKEITKTQFLILKLICEYKERNNGKHPSIAFIGSKFDVSGSAIALQLNQLRDKGYIDKVFHPNSHKLKELKVLVDFSDEKTLKDLTGLTILELRDLCDGKL